MTTFAIFLNLPAEMEVLFGDVWMPWHGILLSTNYSIARPLRR